LSMDLVLAEHFISEILTESMTEFEHVVSK
jgi:hypothetical protein